MERRKFLKIAGTTGVIFAATGAGLGTFIATRTPDRALLPWEIAGTSYPDPIRRALSYAILAPNPHNRQPWQVALKGDTEAILTCDLGRLLPETDPFDRQIVIGLGCFLELFRLAAAQEGYRADISLFPEGEPAERVDTRPIAHLRLIADSDIEPEPLFQHVLTRRTNRNPYDTSRPIGEAELDAIVATADSTVISGAVGQGSQLQSLRQLTREALRGEILDPAAFGESIELMRIGRAEIEASPDGIALGGPLMDTLGLLGMISRTAMADPNSSSFQIGLDMADEQALTAMGFVWINTLGNSRSDQVTAGQNYMRVALQVTSLGLAMQPMSQALQEYEAMQPWYQEIHALLANQPDERVQMLARLGYAKQVPPAPRWSLQSRLSNT